jgi:uncharacterized protein
MATVILKATEECNSRCVYCDVVRKESRKHTAMSLEVLELFFYRANEFLAERPSEILNVIWHGGEPLLLSPSYYEEAYKFQEKYCADTSIRIKHGIQSNLTTLTREHLVPLKKMGITCIGTSYDPVPNIRGIGKSIDSQKYNARFMEAIRLLDEEKLGWGIIYVVTKQSLLNPIGILHFLSNLSPNGSFMMNPVLVYGKGLDDIKITPTEYVDFLGEIFPIWWKHRNIMGRVDPFFSIVRNLTDDCKSLICSDSGKCANTHIDLMPDGRASHCGRSADWGLLSYGSIIERSLSDILSDPQRKVLSDRDAVLQETECKGCRFWDICHGGCPLDGWAASGNLQGKSEWCFAKKGFIEKYVEPALAASSPAGDR